LYSSSAEKETCVCSGIGWKQSYLIYTRNVWELPDGRNFFLCFSRIDWLVCPELDTKDSSHIPNLMPKMAYQIISWYKILFVLFYPKIKLAEI
jgi:hypothetical protein